MYARQVRLRSRFRRRRTPATLAPTTDVENFYHYAKYLFSRATKKLLAKLKSKQERGN